MTSTDRRLLFLIMLLSIVVVTALLLRGSDGQTTSTDTSASTVTTQPSVVTTTTSEPVSRSLPNRVIAFEQVFFARYPELTATEYLAALEPFASAEFLAWIDADAVSGGFYDEWRQQGYSVRASLDVDDLTIDYDSTGDGAFVSAIVNLELHRDGDFAATAGSVHHQTEWRYMDGRWLVYPSPPA